MEDHTALRLLKWSEEMGYVYRNGFDRDCADNFNKLCKDRTRRLWDDVMSRVKPLSHVDHIRKNILLLRLRKGNSPSNFELSGSLGQQVKRRNKLKELQIQKQALSDELSTLESSIRNIQKNKIKKYSQASVIQNQLKQFHLKGEIIRIKERDCEFFKSLLDDLNATAKSFISLETESNKHLGLELVLSRVEKCFRIVEDYQMWCKESAKAENILDEEEYQSELKKKKEELWKGVSGVVGNIPPEETWKTLLSHFMEMSVQEMTSLASSVNLKAELETLREEGITGKQTSRDLSSTHVAIMTETANDLLEAEVLSRKLDLVLESIVDGAQMKIPTDPNATKPSHFPRDRMLECLRVRNRQVHLEAVKTALKEEVERLRKKSQDLSSCAQRLKQEQSGIARLDHQIEEVKTMVEQNLRSIHEVKSNLRKAQQDVVDELDSFPERCTFAKDIVSTSSGEDTINSTLSTTNRNMVFNSTALSNTFEPSTFVCSTPFPKGPSALPPPGSQVFPLDDTALENASIDSISPRKKIREIISTLRNAVSKESKTFFKLPLDLVPNVKLFGLTENVSDLLVESPTLIARLACTGGSAPKQLVPLSPFVTTDTQLLFLHIYQNLGHVRAGRLQHLLSPTLPTTLCAGLTHDYLRVTAPDQDSNTREYLSQIVTMVENAKDIVAEDRELLDIWVQRPMQVMIPDSLQVDGKTLKEWKRKYDALVAKIM